MKSQEPKTYIVKLHPGKESQIVTPFMPSPVDKFHVKMATRMLGDELPAGIYKLTVYKKHFGLTHTYHYRQMF